MRRDWSNAVNLSYSYPAEEDFSELSNRTVTTSRKVVYKDISLFEVEKVLKELDHDYEVSLTAKLKELPEDEDTDDDAEAAANPIIPQ